MGKAYCVPYMEVNVSTAEAIWYILYLIM